MIRGLFQAFTTALRGGKGGAAQSTVATAKALHLLAPGFLPLWDNAIALAYGHVLMCANDYLSFCWQMKVLAEAVVNYVDTPDACSLLKRIDEFNYAVFTTGWAKVARTQLDRG